MRNMNCRNIQREIEEAGSAELLSVAATSHLEACAACEIVARQQTKLQAIVSSLGTVEAPGDFDFRLRARLAGEKHASAQPLGNLLFSLRFAAIAATLMLIGSLVVFVALKPDSGNSLAGGSTDTPRPATTASGPTQTKAPVNVTPGSNELATGNLPVADVPPRREPKEQRTKNDLATLRNANRIGAQDSSSKGAPVITRDQLAESYPSAAFPINASYQSHKVSVDNGRGTSRTISLPSVSFGWQRTLSQTPSPLFASARDSW